MVTPYRWYLSSGSGRLTTWHWPTPSRLEWWRCMGTRVRTQMVRRSKCMVILRFDWCRRTFWCWQARSLSRWCLFCGHGYCRTWWLNRHLGIGVGRRYLLDAWAHYTQTRAIARAVGRTQPCYETISRSRRKPRPNRDGRKNGRRRSVWTRKTNSRCPF